MEQAALSRAFHQLEDAEVHEQTSFAADLGHGGYDSMEAANSQNLDAETVLDIAGDVQIIEPRKYRFKRTKQISSWPLKLMPHAMAGMEGTISRSCVVTAVAKKMTIQPTGETRWMGGTTTSRSLVAVVHCCGRRGKWLKVRVRGGKEGWMQSEIMDGTVILTECKSYRRHEEWGGYNRFFVCGHVMLGSDVRWFVCSNITLAVPVAAFIFEVCLRFPVRGGTTLACIGLALWGFAMVNLWITALTDPGIIPPNPSNARALPPDGETIGLHGFKYCDTCNIFRPPRSKHCQSCNNCVDRFDHHCPWVGSCVAVRNYRFFFFFVTGTVLLIAYMLAVCVARIVLRVVVLGDGSVPKALEIIASGPVDLLIIAMAIVVGLPLFRLWLYHVYTILGKGQTTNEDMRHVYRDHYNEYNKGCTRNSYSLLCAPAPRSRMPDMSELVYVGRDPRRTSLSGGGGRRRESNSSASNRTRGFLSFIAPAGGFGLGGEGGVDGGYAACPPSPPSSPTRALGVDIKSGFRFGSGGTGLGAGGATSMPSSVGSDLSLKGGGSSGGGSYTSSVGGEAPMPMDMGEDASDGGGSGLSEGVVGEPALAMEEGRQVDAGAEENLPLLRSAGTEEDEGGGYTESIAPAAASIEGLASSAAMMSWPERKLDGGDDHGSCLVIDVQKDEKGSVASWTPRPEGEIENNDVNARDAKEGHKPESQSDHNGGGKDNQVKVAGGRRDGRGSSGGTGGGGSEGGMTAHGRLTRADSGGVSPLVGLSYANSPRSTLDLHSIIVNRGFGAVRGSDSSNAMVVAAAATAAAGTSDEAGDESTAAAATGGAALRRDAGTEDSHSSGELGYSPTPSSSASLSASATGTSGGVALSGSGDGDDETFELATPPRRATARAAAVTATAAGMGVGDGDGEEESKGLLAELRGEAAAVVAGGEAEMAGAVGAADSSGAVIR